MRVTIHINGTQWETVDMQATAPLRQMTEIDQCAAFARALAAWYELVGGGVDDCAVAALGDPEGDFVIVELDLAACEYAQ